MHNTYFRMIAYRYNHSNSHFYWFISCYINHSSTITSFTFCKTKNYEGNFKLKTNIFDVNINVVFELVKRSLIHYSTYTLQFKISNEVLFAQLNTNKYNTIIYIIVHYVPSNVIIFGLV